MHCSVFIANQPTSQIDDFLVWICEIFSDLGTVSVDRTIACEADLLVFLDGTILSSSDRLLLADSKIPIVYVPSEWLVYNNYTSDYAFNSFSRYHKLLDLLSKIICTALMPIVSGYRHFLFRVPFKIFDLILPGFKYRFELRLRVTQFRALRSRFNAVLSPDPLLTRSYLHELPSSDAVFTCPPFVSLDTVNLACEKFIDSHTSRKFLCTGRLTRYRARRLKTSLFSNCVVRLPSSSPTDSFSADIYIPQSSDWPYSSVMRSYRTLRLGRVPVQSELCFPDPLMFLSPSVDVLFTNDTMKLASWKKSTLLTYQEYYDFQMGQRVQFIQFILAKLL